MFCVGPDRDKFDILQNWYQPLLLNNGDIMKSNIQSLDRVNEGVVGLRYILGWSYDKFLVLNRVNESESG
jgi:hypothetical protein